MSYAALCKVDAFKKNLNTSFFMLFTDGKILLHVIGRSQDDGDSLVDAGGLDVQDVHGSRGGHASCLLHDVGHGVAFIQQSQLRDERQK